MNSALCTISVDNSVESLGSQAVNDYYNSVTAVLDKKTAKIIYQSKTNGYSA